MHAWVQGDRKRAPALGTGVDHVIGHNRFWEPNLGSPQVQQVLLTPEPVP